MLAVINLATILEFYIFQSCHCSKQKEFVICFKKVSEERNESRLYRILSKQCSRAVRFLWSSPTSQDNYSFACLI